MKEDRYKNREIDEKFSEVHTRFNTQDETLAKILAQTTATNGKVRKIVLALVALGFYVLGVTGGEIIPFLTKIL